MIDFAEMKWGGGVAGQVELWSHPMYDMIFLFHSCVLVLFLLEYNCGSEVEPWCQTWKWGKDRRMCHTYLLSTPFRRVGFESVSTDIHAPPLPEVFLPHPQSGLSFSLPLLFSLF